MYVVFATCEQEPLTAADDQILADALKARGVEVTPIPWTEIDPYATIDSPPIVIRSTWDYHRMPTMFASWLDALADSGRRTWNPPGVARSNIDKVYLKALAAAGIAIPETRWLDRADHESVAAVMRQEQWHRAVLKPRIAATAYGTFLIDRDTTIDEAGFGPVRASGAFIQEVIPEVIERGEISLVYLASDFSHAVIKQAKAGEFRVQKDFGGTVAVMTPPPALRSFADRIMATVPPDCLYARVDVVDSGRGPLLMELELIEPELYFLNVPAAADHLADLIVERLR
jgi:glutathione synthase/RimK-type ligase-like ATP-grasp enzyme